jgi:hypothetical protein
MNDDTTSGFFMVLYHMQIEANAGRESIDAVEWHILLDGIVLLQKHPVWSNDKTNAPRALALPIMMHVLLACLRRCYQIETFGMHKNAIDENEHSVAMNNLGTCFVDLLRYAQELFDANEHRCAASVPVAVPDDQHLLETFLFGIDFIKHLLTWGTDSGGCLDTFKMSLVRAPCPSGEIPSHLDTCLTYLLLNCSSQKVRSTTREALECIACDAIWSMGQDASRKGIVMAWIHKIPLEDELHDATLQGIFPIAVASNYHRYTVGPAT